MIATDYTSAEVITPDGRIGKYLSFNEYTGKVLVLIDWNHPPVEFDCDKCSII